MEIKRVKDKDLVKKTFLGCRDEDEDENELAN